MYATAIVVATQTVTGGVPSSPPTCTLASLYPCTVCAVLVKEMVQPALTYPTLPRVYSTEQLLYVWHGWLTVMVVLCLFSMNCQRRERGKERAAGGGAEFSVGCIAGRTEDGEFHLGHLSGGKAFVCVASFLVLVKPASVRLFCYTHTHAVADADRPLLVSETTKTRRRRKRQERRKRGGRRRRWRRIMPPTIERETREGPCDVAMLWQRKKRTREREPFSA